MFRVCGDWVGGDGDKDECVWVCECCVWRVGLVVVGRWGGEILRGSVVGIFLTEEFLWIIGREGESPVSTGDVGIGLWHSVVMLMHKTQ